MRQRDGEALRRFSGRPTPALDRLIGVATSLGPLRSEIVFIGGAIAPLLQVKSPLPLVRPTRDVDAIVASRSYTAFESVREQLRMLRFVETMPTASQKGHAHRWRAPDGTPFDLVPSGDHLGASGSWIDEHAVATAESVELAPGLVIRHASACGFLALKWAAYRDRGKHAPLASHDLEDIVALVASRPEIVDEVSSADARIQALMASEALELLALTDAQELIVAHIGRAAGAERIGAEVQARLEAMTKEKSR